jgi:hypothetical protein
VIIVLELSKCLKIERGEAIEIKLIYYTRKGVKLHLEPSRGYIRDINN